MSVCGHAVRLKPLVVVALKVLRSYRNEERNMKPSTKDQIKGKIHELKGKVKETAGQATNNPDLAAKGQGEQLAGKIQKKVGQIEKVFEN
jgi:uncharacterized protein YjbJ (UPF0337 family)